MHLRIYFFSFLFFFFLFLIWYTFHKWTSLWLLNTSCTISFFVFHKHNRGDIQLRFKQNKHHPFKPIFFNDFFFFRQMHHCFSFFKILYSSKETICIFLFSPVTVGGTATMFYYAENISATICQNTFWSWQNGILQCLQFVCVTQRVLITVVHDMNYYKEST